LEAQATKSPLQALSRGIDRYPDLLGNLFRRCALHVEAHRRPILGRQSEQSFDGPLSLLLADLPLKRRSRLAGNLIWGEACRSTVLSTLACMKVPPSRSCLPSKPSDQKGRKTRLVAKLESPELGPEIPQYRLDQVSGIQEPPQPRVEVDHPDLKQATEEVADELLLQACLFAELSVDCPEHGIFRR